MEVQRYNSINECNSRRDVLKSFKAILSQIQQSDSDESEDGFLLSPQHCMYEGMNTLVLDLDETLVHSQMQPTRDCDFSFHVLINGTFHMIYVKKRPGVDEFLARVFNLFEVITFTAGD